MSMRLAMYVSMYIYTYEKVSWYRASEHKIYVYASSCACALPGRFWGHLILL